MDNVTNVVQVINLGRTDYKSCWDLQQRLLEHRRMHQVPDVLLLTEHNHVYTIGKSGDDKHLLATEAELRGQGIRVYHNDRGGDITYHGPGQLVGYPILDLHDYYLDLHRYLRDLEEVIIRTLATYDIIGSRLPGYTGVWVGMKKICAIGVKTSHWVTMHGFALNVNTDLSFFDGIIPCGISEKGVSSVQRETSWEVDLDQAGEHLTEQFGTVFGVEVRRMSIDELGRGIEETQLSS
jgi:lipoyl(octanoyl) transferase